jgi:hypothetical protein
MQSSFYFLKNVQTSSLPSWGFAVLIYGDQQRVMAAENIISNLISKQKKSTLTICALTALVTIATVFIFTHEVAISLARPLRKLIAVASVMNSNTKVILDKQRMKSTMLELDEIERNSEY